MVSNKTSHVHDRSKAIEACLFCLSRTFYKTLSSLYIFLCCSRKRNVRIVWGPTRMKLGTQPLNIQRMPSCLVISVTRLTMLWCAFELITRVLITSTGEQIVVATKPAKKEAVKCVDRPSFRGVYSRSVRLNPSYVANCPTVINTALEEFGHTPFHRLPTPSSRAMRNTPSTAFL